MTAAPATPVPPAAPRLFASPLARRLARAAGLDLGGLHGSGPGGRVVAADVARARAEAAARPPAPATPSAVTAPLPATPIPATPEPGGWLDLPLSPVRRVIARRLTDSKRTIPHFSLSLDCAMDEVLAVRTRMQDGPRAVKVSVNDFVIRAVALALRDVPDLNAQWADDAVRRFADVDVAVAGATDGGLITPIIRRADGKGVARIADEMAALAARARAGGLRPDEFQGGGFTISNLGMYGIARFTAIINPPQAAILAVGAVEARPVVRDGALAVGRMMTLTLSVDHRIVDGAVAARFLSVLRAHLEAPLGLLI